jgi:hypothetical protein
MQHEAAIGGWLDALRSPGRLPIAMLTTRRGCASGSVRPVRAGWRNGRAESQSIAGQRLEQRSMTLGQRDGGSVILLADSEILEPGTADFDPARPARVAHECIRCRAGTRSGFHHREVGLGGTTGGNTSPRECLPMSYPEQCPRPARRQPRRKCNRKSTGTSSSLDSSARVCAPNYSKN